MSELIWSLGSIHNLFSWIFFISRILNTSIWNSLLKITVPCFFLFVSLPVLA